MDQNSLGKTTSAFDAIGVPGRDLSRLLAETLEAAVTVIDPDGIVLYASSYFEELFGVSCAEIVGRRYTDFMSPEDREIALELLRGITRGERYPVITWHLHRRSGPPIWAEARVSVLRDDAGVVTGYLTVTRDMTDRRLASQALVSTRANYDALVRRAVYGVFRAERNAQLLDVNQAMIDLLGYATRDELMAVDLRTTVYAEASDHEWMMRTAEEGELEDWVDVTWRKRDGSLIDVRVSLRIVEDEYGGPPVFEGIAENVTERRLNEDRIRRSERMASLGHMLAGVAHELNNPLAAISGFTQLLQRGSWAEEDRKALETIGREARRAERVVKDLLTFARQGTVVRNEVVDLHGVISHIVETQRYALDTRGVRVALLLTPEPVFVQGDGARLEQVMLNLVVNARQALEAMRGQRGAEQAPLELRIETETESNKSVVIRVTDTGAGIAPSLLTKIWDPFFTTKDEGVGTGLGLSVVHSIVTEHAGSVDVQSELGRGTQFTVRLPLAVMSEVSALPSTVAAKPTADTARAGRALDILVVDDEAAIISFLTRFLSSRGHAVVGAADGAQALRISEQYTFDVVVCDLHMPEMDGVELIRRMRTLPSCKNSRFILSSGDGSGSPTMTRAAALGVDALLAKPYTIDYLVEVVEAIPAALKAART
jgi:two-component system, cell cycle sensor histidine kinase and response regulator CckA